MTLKNDFIPFATRSDANVNSQAEYVANSFISTNTGIPPYTTPLSSRLLNKALRQGIAGSNALGKLLNHVNVDALDNTEFSTNLISTLPKLVSSATVARTMTPVANEYILIPSTDGGLFVGSTASASDNGGSYCGTCISAATGSWNRIYDGFIQVKWFGAKGDSTTDDTSAIRNALSAGSIAFHPGDFLVSANISVPSYRILAGNNTYLIYQSSWSPTGSFLILSGITDVEVYNITFQGKGVYHASNFTDEYNHPDSIGFSNSHTGIKVTHSNNISLHDNQFIGLCQPINIQNSYFINIVGNNFQTVGDIGIYIGSSSRVHITGMNLFTDINGGLYQDGTIPDNALADGIHVNIGSTILVEGNSITRYNRAGIYLDTYIADTNISNNSINNGTSTTIALSGIYADVATASSDTCTIQNNIIVTSNANISIGISSTGGRVVENTVSGCASIGIQGTYCSILNNKVRANEIGIQVSSQSLYVPTTTTTSVVAHTEVKGNTVSNNNKTGIHIYRCKGVIGVKDNTILDNGATSVSDQNHCSGVLIQGVYTYDQMLSISNNLFMNYYPWTSSTGDAADYVEPIQGQSYAVFYLADDGHQLFQESSLIGNTFIFNNPTPFYPTCLTKKPCSFGYDTNGGKIVNEVMNGNAFQNYNQKLPFLNTLYAAGKQNIVGYSSTEPASSRATNTQSLSGVTWSPTTGGITGSFEEGWDFTLSSDQNAYIESSSIRYSNFDDTNARYTLHFHIITPPPTKNGYDNKYILIDFLGKFYNLPITGTSPYFGIITTRGTASPTTIKLHNYNLNSNRAYWMMCKIEIVSITYTTYDPAWGGLTPNAGDIVLNTTSAAASPTGWIYTHQTDGYPNGDWIPYGTTGVHSRDPI